MDTTTSKIKETKYLFQITRDIQPKESLNNLKDKIRACIPTIDHAEYLVIYNPDKWKYEVFYFLNELSHVKEMNGVIYQILHISQEVLLD